MSFLSRQVISIILVALQILNKVSPTWCDQLRSNNFSLELSLNNFLGPQLSDLFSHQVMKMLKMSLRLPTRSYLTKNKYKLLKSA